MDPFEFAKYVWSFYAPGQLYGAYFNNNLTKKELIVAVAKQVQLCNFEGDSFDREAVRDLMLSNREVA